MRKVNSATWDLEHYVVCGGGSGGEWLHCNSCLQNKKKNRKNSIYLKYIFPICLQFLQVRTNYAQINMSILHSFIENYFNLLLHIK